ncbi:MAG: CTB family bacteriocin [Elainella sp. Prado103]|jgi:hypothetical protein|nr:CTB family bacteriocin [Elainella sp. Prado103]
MATEKEQNQINPIDLTAMANAEMGAMELSEDELDGISGGMSLNFGDVDSFAQKSGNFFSQKNLSIGQATFAGPEGSGTISQIDFQGIESGAFQDIAIN